MSGTKEAVSPKPTGSQATQEGVKVMGEEITTKEELRAFLLNVQDKLSDDTAPPIYCLTAMNFLFNGKRVHELLDEETRELSRNIWLRLDAAGFILRQPPLLFGTEVISG